MRAKRAWIGNLRLHTPLGVLLVFINKRGRTFVRTYGHALQNEPHTKSDLRKIGITIGVILLIIAGFLFWKEKESSQILLTFGVTLCILGIVIPFILKPIYWVWMIFATILGWIMTRVILSLLFYIIFTPIGLILRIFGKQFLEFNWDHSKQSYWNLRTVETFNKENYERQF